MQHLTLTLPTHSQPANGLPAGVGCDDDRGHVPAPHPHRGARHLISTGKAGKVLLGCTLETTDAVSHGQTVPHSMDWATARAHLPVPVPANLDFTLGTVLARTTNYLSSRRLLSSSVWSIIFGRISRPGARLDIDSYAPKSPSRCHLTIRTSLPSHDHGHLHVHVSNRLRRAADGMSPPRYCT